MVGEQHERHDTTFNASGGMHNADHSADDTQRLAPRWVLCLGRYDLSGQPVMKHRLKFFGEDFAHKMKQAMNHDWPICFIESVEEIRKQQ